MVRPLDWGRPNLRPGYESGHWSDPIGAAYDQWKKASPADRIALMLETVIDLAMQGYPIREVVKAFAEVAEFRAIARYSYPMCRVLTSALVGQRLDPSTMSFDRFEGLFGTHAAG
jgi:hypothetical protein